MGTNILLEAFGNVFALHNVVYLLVGSVAGLILGILPGLGPVFACALFLPFTFGLEADSAILLLSAVYASTAYGDAITSILLNVPGGPGAVAMVFDGYPLTQKGKASYALGAMTCSSLVGGLIGVLSLIFIAPQLSEAALAMGPAEYFMLALFGISMVAVAGKGDTGKGLILGCMGLIVSSVGTDVTTGARRFDFGSEFLSDGIPFVAATIGLFALSQMFNLTEENGNISGDYKLGADTFQGVKEVFKNWFTTLRSAVMGVGIGMIPGIGISIASFMSYLVEQRMAKAADRDSYGKGNIRGVIAPQTATNACVSGELIPAFALGIPGGATAAIFLAALSLHGLRPGLSFFSSGGTLVPTIFIGMIIAQFIFFIIGITASKQLAKVTKVPNAILVSVIVILCFAGAFSIRKEMLDIVIAIIFGLVGYVLFRNKWPVQCLILGMVLGPIAESNFHRALQISNGSFGIFVGGPFAMTMFVIIVGILLWTYIGGYITKLFQKGAKA